MNLPALETGPNTRSADEGSPSLLTVPTPHVPAPDSLEREVLVRRVTVEADRVISIELVAADGRRLPPWTPGAHISLRLGSGLVREYSLCGDPDDREVYRIAVLDEPLGRGGSHELHDTAERGARLVIRGPRNHFPLVPAERYLFIAGGIGVTPILPMVRTVAAGAVDWSLLYGGRSLSSMAFVDDLMSICGSRLTLVAQDRMGLPDIVGFLSGADTATAVYCCGPTGLIEVVRQRCREAGILDSLHLERFGPAPQAAPVDAPTNTERAIDVELRRSGKRVTVPPGRSILHAVRDVLPWPSSCEEGYCGTCEARVLDGVPDHRDTILSEEERAQGDCMMICVSRARTPTLTLDL